MVWGFPGHPLPAVGITDMEWGPQCSPFPALAGGLCLVASSPSVLPIGASSCMMVAAAVVFGSLEVGRKSRWMFPLAQWLERSPGPLPLEWF